jgi:hypothetical protein
MTLHYSDVHFNSWFFISLYLVIYVKVVSHALFMRVVFIVSQVLAGIGRLQMQNLSYSCLI